MCVWLYYNIVQATSSCHTNQDTNVWNRGQGKATQKVIPWT